MKDRLMEVIDKVQAGSLEDSDHGLVIGVDGTEYEIRGVSESSDLHEVVVSAYNLVTGDIETLELPFDYDVEILGA